MRAATVLPGTIHRVPADLVGGHTGGTFYIRARLRAGACVSVVGETLGRPGFTGEGQRRVAEPLAVWTLSPRSPDPTGCGLLTCEACSPPAEGRVSTVGQGPTATHPTSGVGGG